MTKTTDFNYKLKEALLRIALCTCHILSEIEYLGKGVSRAHEEDSRNVFTSELKGHVGDMTLRISNMKTIIESMMREVEKLGEYDGQ